MKFRFAETEPARRHPSGARRVRRNGLYAGVIAVVAVLAGYKGVLPVFRGELRDYLSIGDGYFGLLFGIGPFAGLVGLLFGGWAIDRWGTRRVMRCCLAGIATAMFMLAFAGPRFPIFALAMGLSGLFSAPFSVAVSAYLARLFPNHRRRIISLNLASTSLGGLMFPLVAEVLLHWSRQSDVVTFGQVLHLPFLLVGSLVLGASQLYRGQTSSPLGAGRKTPGKRWRGGDLILPPRAFGLAFLLALHGLADNVLYTWMPRFLESGSFPAQPVPPGLALSGYALAYLSARGLLALLPEKVGRRAFLAWPGIVGGGFLCAGLLSRQYMLAVGGYVLGALCWSCEYPAMVGALLRHDRQRFGSTMAVSGLMGGCFYFAAMNVIGRSIEHRGDTGMWMLMLFPAVIFVAVGVGGWLWSRRFDPLHS